MLQKTKAAKKAVNQTDVPDPGQHRMPLYFIPVSVRVRLARTLLKRLLSKS